MSHESYSLNISENSVAPATKTCIVSSLEWQLGAASKGASSAHIRDDLGLHFPNNFQLFSLDKGCRKNLGLY